MSTIQPSALDNRAKWLGAAGILILLFGIIIFISARRYIFPSPDKQSKPALQRELLDTLSKAEPEFQIGYAIIALDKFKSMQHQAFDDSDLLHFSVWNNDVATRIKYNNPLLHPDYAALKRKGVLLADFFNAYRRKKVALLEVGVGCLIIKQIGKGDADSVRLDVSKVLLNEPVEMYDGTDIGTNYTTSSVLEPDNKIIPEKALLGPMNTGASLLVPLYITNLFTRLDGKTDPSGWQVVSNTVYVPVTLRYYHHNKSENIEIRNILARPIDIR